MKKRTRTETKRIIDAIEADIAAGRTKLEKPGHVFVSLERKALERKLRRAKSPMFDWIGWNSAAPQGGTIDVNVGIVNPDPVPWSTLAVHAFVGARNPIVQDDQFLDTFDVRFPLLAKPSPVGFQLNPGGFTQLVFSLPIPPGVEKTGYFLNVVLFRIDFLDRGAFLDRGCAFFEVV